ncbi:MAG: beta-hexosaminidase, partial [Caulobacter sp.]|nr:beta-hexosaminidase [Caulobacter sp.]
MMRLAPLFAALFAVVAVTPAQARPIALTPAPAAMVPAEGSFALTPATRIFVASGDAEARDAAAYLAALLAKARGLKPAVVEGAPKAGEAGIVLARGGPTAVDAYGLTVAPAGVTVTATTRGGLLYGAVSVWQLATQTPGRGAVTLTALRIDDAPRFAWRGLMVDSARHYQDPATLRAIIDAMAAHKLNVLHWHLVD